MVALKNKIKQNNTKNFKEFLMIKNIFEELNANLKHVQTGIIQSRNL